MLIAIWAQDKNGLIGKDNKLPWYLPNDLKFFKNNTINNTLVMGRKTFEGMGGRPLPDRETIILTKDPNYKAENVKILHSIDEVIGLANRQSTPVFVGGGTEIFRELLPHFDYLYRTFIDEVFTGDTYMPEVDWSQWKLKEEKEGVVDERNHYKHRFEIYERV
ncbi:dihydrofolate reductase [Tetragenococcus halophilus]|uniref:Dihydrofolate reductase n=2 Tax=Tetragenococcus halophilus TaxID=51669 RepID=A0AAN1SI64_TETHN|nr:dihydrofolate reductase [Tetragenococcus halophilus]AYW50590.1 dihydrofolate reductase [Tetragenococcus halophilus]MCF1675501.1 dihydrofolate reductase [Tetragenococcus halophilus]MCO7026211.1 dihydrofolate reductase [Tetragenococcus halophilus]NWO00063.1 dihydrofolate reductase [Tetragenococcus halophilus]WJS82966.1 dihydrofolate reductase [Tetragenococcus halophilus]